ncbi:hypothetical protein [Gimesia aquarii]|uniref:Uncharacterized protein n=1 Tax=Gimesia aquarii TaxID=2527964 RepID=A0A517X2Y3_9PLAN|nr:hypothetical protein [Gimesia aquarii]QDU11865.1 hypothetical protein V202x_52900 [Gimesia aquarii]
MSKKKPFSFFKGYSYSFEDDGRNIEVWCSAFSGLEKVFVDGTLVSSKRNISTQSSNKFHIGEDSYSTTLKVVSLFKGPFLCTLSKNGKDIKRQKLVFHSLKDNSGTIPHWLRFLFYLLFYVTLFLAFAVAKVYLHLPQESYIDFLFSLVVVASIFLSYRIVKDGSKFEIVDEEII